MNTKLYSLAALVLLGTLFLGCTQQGPTNADAQATTNSLDAELASIWVTDTPSDSSQVVGPPEEAVADSGETTWVTDSDVSVGDMI